VKLLSHRIFSIPIYLRQWLPREVYWDAEDTVRQQLHVQFGTANIQTAGLLMELASASLGDKLAQTHCLPRKTILRWLHEVAQGIEFAHGCGVVHSDIKPDNIMIVGNEEPQAAAKVTDFGSASILSTVGASTTTVRGTPMFIAPEYAAGDTGPTRASDVFSFGMTMWCALVPQGTEHGLGRTDIQVAMALHLGRRPLGRRPPVAAIDASLVGLIERCWAADPSARPSMVEVEEALRSLVVLPTQSRLTPSMQLWSTLLQPLGVEAAFQQLQFQQNGHLFLSPALDTTHPCHQLICTKVGSHVNNVRRVVMVGTDASTASCFAKLHEAEMNSRARNPALRVQSPTDAASVAGLGRLKQSFIPVTTAPGDPLPCARLLLAWHGTSSDKVDAVCRDGPRSLRTTDCGYFGAGSYFALEAAYALRYSSPDPASGESALILYTLSVSQAKVITPQGDYRPVEDPSTPQLHGFSQYYSGNRNTAVALAPACDAHFIPVKDYGLTHPLTGLITPRNVGYQAVDASIDTAEGHEIVIASYHRCIPIAVVYFRN
ncbi:serine-threonine protein kinase, putative, partial [Bodo saltans]